MEQKTKMTFVDFKKVCSNATKVNVVSVTGRPLAKNIYIKDSIIFDYLEIVYITNSNNFLINVCVNCR